MMIASRRRSRAASAIVRWRTAEPVATSSGASTDPDPEPHLIRCQTSEKIAASGWRTEGRGMSRPKRGDVMTHITRARTTLVIIAVAAGVLAASAAARTETAAAPKPIVIGAVVDLTKNMAPFDAPALLAAQLEIKAINKKGGVDGRPLKMVFLNDQLDTAKTKQ